MFVPGPSSLKMLVLFLILVQVSQHALGDEVSKGLWVNEGQKSVVLPCFIPGGLGDITSVVWTRFDLDPPVLQQQRDPDIVLNPQYSSRTSISTDFLGIFYRDLSLTLDKPRLSDSGTYTCTVHSRVHGVMQRIVKLQVTEPFTLLISIWVVHCVLCIVALVVVVALGVAAYLWINTITVSQVEVSEGESFVKLPYITMVRLPEDHTVEWSRCTHETMKVHVYHNASSHIIDQDQIYRGRTSMKQGSRTNGELILRDFSLTLKDPCYRDSGTYICTVHRGREILMQKVIRLHVKVAQEKVETGDWSKTFTLPFVTTAQLPEDSTVEWTRSEPKNMTVHVFENGKDQPCKQDECYLGKTRMNSDPLRSRDLSLTVSNSGCSDTGTYICTVRREGFILAQKKVLHRVRGGTYETVEVDWTAQTVKLPWLIKADLPEHASVEWKRSMEGNNIYTRKVHVFKDGQDQPDQQDQSYQGRTTMRRNPLQSGDLSLTLNDPNFQDHGTYKCVVQVNGETVWEKTVQLQGQYWR
ncbi:uncharacterized protein LOC117805730 [Notolabrus celidotus]|uniref:uncharacterized protein LOC117805730 n=1 Tax=Notolabrus celidotus TaxID=1203425 RepID=UPI00148F85C1|nr:uncharacterized protein LOC117805730 [Notolabrus celidotus]